jgi:hypothetical protein
VAGFRTLDAIVATQVFESLLMAALSGLHLQKPQIAATVPLF